MTATDVRPPPASTEKSLGQHVVRLLTTTDHKLIGKMYLVTSFDEPLGVSAALVGSQA